MPLFSFQLFRLFPPSLFLLISIVTFCLGRDLRRWAPCQFVSSHFPFFVKIVSGLASVSPLVCYGPSLRFQVECVASSLRYFQASWRVAWQLPLCRFARGLISFSQGPKSWWVTHQDLVRLINVPVIGVCLSLVGYTYMNVVVLTL